MSGFNSNSVVVIKSEEIAKLYKKEFEQMYQGNFHNLKSKNNTEQTIDNIVGMLFIKDLLVSSGINLVKLSFVP